MSEFALESESTAAIAKAFAGAQAEIKAPKKSRTAKVQMKSGGTYSYSYADLSDVIECLREPFAKHGLSQSQAMRSPGGHVEIVTTIRHESGEWIRSYYPIASHANPQEMGSAISYGRRYALTSLAGLMAEDDDDGQQATDASKKKTEARKPDAPKVEPPITKLPDPLPADMITDAELAEVRVFAHRAGLTTVNQLAPVLRSICGVYALGAIPRKELANVLDALSSMPQVPQAAAK